MGIFISISNVNSIINPKKVPKNRMQAVDGKKGIDKCDWIYKNCSKLHIW